VLQEVDELPQEISSDEPLPHSAFNVYGLLPAGINSCEILFVEMLDSDMAGKVFWWHRNPPHRNWSVQSLLTSDRAFSPISVIGIKGRPTPDNVLLADTKYAFETGREAH
jgi:hypothetical protein